MADHEALHKELRSLHAVSFAWARACCHDHDADAEDVLQTTYEKILDGRARFDGHSGVKTWLFSVITRTAADNRRRGVRRRRRHDALAVVPRETTTEAPAEPPSLIHDAVRALSENQRAMVELVFFHDLSVREAADVLGLQLGTARTHYARAKAALRERLGGGHA